MLASAAILHKAILDYKLSGPFCEEMSQSSDSYDFEDEEALWKQEARPWS